VPDERPPSLSLAELVMYLDGDLDLALRILRLLRIPCYGKPPASVKLSELEQLLERRADLRPPA
jgi:hypothetical protein